MSSNIKLQRVCEYCNKVFIAKTTVTRFCSHTCNSRNYKKNQRDSKVIHAKEELKQKVLCNSDYTLQLNCKPYLTIKETCLLLNISDTTLRKLIKTGQLKTYRVGIKHIIRKSDIDSQFKFVL